MYTLLLEKYNTIDSVFLTWYQSHLPVAMVFCPYGIFKSNLRLPWCFFAAFIFFGFLLLSSKLFGIVKPLLEVASTLQDYCLPQTTIIKPNFIQGIFSTLQISRFHQTSILSLRGGIRDILAISIGPSLILLYVQAKSPTCIRSLLV